MFKISLNPMINNNFRNKINEYFDFSSKKVDKQNNNIWNTICAIMDRIDDVVIYLNEKELYNGRWKRCAFDFFEFLEQAGVLVECIDLLFKKYDIIQPKHNVIFKNKSININYLVNAQNNNQKIKDTDDDYFQYIRSLSSVHPTNTDRHKIFQDGEIEVSPYVVWKDGIYVLDKKCDGDLVLVTYNNDTSDFLINKSLYMNEIFNFVKSKYYSLNNLTKKIDRIYNNQISDLRKTMIKKSRNYSDYSDYLDEIILQSEIRFPDLTDTIKEVKQILCIKISNQNNIIKYEKYCNALKYSIMFVHRQLQNMDFESNSIGDSLIYDLLSGNIYKEDTVEMNYSYPYSKIVELKQEYGDKMYAKKMYKLLLPFFKEYIDISEMDLYTLPNEKLYVLSQIAIYFHELENDGLVNKLIPNTINYRL